LRRLSPGSGTRVCFADPVACTGPGRRGWREMRHAGPAPREDRQRRSTAPVQRRSDRGAGMAGLDLLLHLLLLLSSPFRRRSIRHSQRQHRSPQRQLQTHGSRRGHGSGLAKPSSSWVTDGQWRHERRGRRSERCEQASEAGSPGRHVVADVVGPPLDVNPLTQFLSGSQPEFESRNLNPSRFAHCFSLCDLRLFVNKRTLLSISHPISPERMLF